LFPQDAKDYYDELVGYTENDVYAFYNDAAKVTDVFEGE
jgi:hypothetical protein